MPTAPRLVMLGVAGAAFFQLPKLAALETSSADSAVFSRLQIDAAPIASLQLNSVASAAFSPCQRHAALGTSSGGNAGSSRPQIYGAPIAALQIDSVASSACVQH